MGEVDRRTFLKSVPGHLLRGVRVLMQDVTMLVSPGQERATHRRIAMLDVSRCLAWGGGSCQLCYLRCPQRDEAVLLEGGKPTIVAAACDGCGVCVDVCRSVNDLGAIHVINFSQPHFSENDSPSSPA